MSDDLLVQKQTQNSNYAVPGLIAGGIAGGAGGVLAAHKGFGIPTALTAEQILDQKPDVFVRMIDKGGDNKEAWQIARDYSLQIAQKRNEYDNKLKIIEESVIPALEEYRKTILPEIDKLQKNNPVYNNLTEQLETAKKANNTELVSQLTDKINRMNDGFVKKAKDIIKDTDARKNYIQAVKDAVNNGIKNIKRGNKLTTEPKDWIDSIGSKEEYINEIKEKAVQEIEPLLDKLKLPSKTLTAALSAMFLAIAGFAIGNAISKKD